MGSSRENVGTGPAEQFRASLTNHVTGIQDRQSWVKEAEGLGVNS